MEKEKMTREYHKYRISKQATQALLLKAIQSVGYIRGAAEISARLEKLYKHLEQMEGVFFDAYLDEEFKRLLGKSKRAAKVARQVEELLKL